MGYSDNTDLAFDTELLKKCATEFADIAQELRGLASNLDARISALQATGWTTQAGRAFYKMTETNWRLEIEKYAAMLEAFKEALNRSAREYDHLVENEISKVELKA